MQWVKDINQGKEKQIINRIIIIKTVTVKIILDQLNYNSVRNK